MSTPARREERHRILSRELQRTSDAALRRLVSGSTRLTTQGYGTLPLPPEGQAVFVKLLPLTDVELEPEHQHSTANMFELPTYYQYRMGGCGFGTWRELEVHRLTTDWVLSGQCTRFPLMYGSRVLPVVSPVEDDKKSLDHWGNHPAIARRVEAVTGSRHSLVLFLEHFPQNLTQSLRGRLQSTDDCVGVMEETEAELRRLLAAIHGRGLTHMDAHFENILTDGSQLFLTDFGLAVSASFALGEAERKFVERHRSFDLVTAITSSVHAVVTRWDSPGEDWREPLRELADGGRGPLASAPERVRAYLARRTPLVLAAGEFYSRLIADLATPYPADSLQRLLDSIP